MPGTKIGIMLANRDFYPVLEEDIPSRKRLVVTTVNDNQTNIQINLYRENRSLSDTPEYLDTLLIEDIDPQKKGEPSIALVIGIDDSKNLFAKATDKDTGNSQSLKVSLAHSGAVISESSFELPDFDVTSFPTSNVDDDPLRDNVLISDSEAEGTLPVELYTPNQDESYNGRKSSKFFILIIVLLVILLLVGAIFLHNPDFLTNVFTHFTTTETEETSSEKTIATEDPAPIPEEVTFVEVPVEPAPEPIKAEEQKPIETVKEAPKKETPVVPKKPAPARKAKTVRYKIKWGDTLWDICGTYYKNPWKYKYLARWNGIKNPDRIISGRYIEIPPQ